MIRRLILAVAGLALAAGVAGMPAAASAAPTAASSASSATASAGTPNHCFDWANPVGHHLPLFCLANETQAEKTPHFRL